MNKIKIAVLGSTGMVGQKVISLLSKSSIFEVTELVASESKINKRYGDIVAWRECPTSLNSTVQNIKITSIEQLSAPWVVSCVPADIANHVEGSLAERGHYVFSNASSNRMNESVPLVVPEINEDSLALLDQQIFKGKIITAPNCVAVPLSLALRPLIELGSIENVNVTSLQALSGAGHSGVSALDIQGNLVPYISGEEEKIINETKKILSGLLNTNSYTLSAQAVRVPVLNGHTLALTVYFREEVNIQNIQNLYTKWNSRHPGLYCLHEQIDKPQPRVDLRDNDMSVHIGRIRSNGSSNVISLIAIADNLVRGAAGGVIANMEAVYRRERSRS